MAVALAALEEGIITPDFHVNCPGHANFYGRDFKCWRFSRGGHGSIDLRHAIEQSCDVYFYTVANMVGVDKINKWATALGMGVMSGIDLPNEVQGLVPSTEWKRQQDAREVVRGRDDFGRHRPGAGVDDADLDGRLHGDARQRRHARDAAPAESRRRRQRLEAGAAAGAAGKTDDRSREACRSFETACGWSSTSRAARRQCARFPATTSSGKTGTAQVISNQGKAAAGKTDTDLRDNGWFVFFAPRDNPQIAGVVFLEHGVHGGNAALVVHHILDTFFAKKDGKPLPPKPTLIPNLNPSMG